jgi:hypothetical protein
MANLEECKLCKEQKYLKNSHAIGNAIFKRIFRNGSGKAISITSENEDIGYTSDSWAEHQLCGDCENLFNVKYEQYALGVLRGRNSNVSKTELGITFSDVNQHKLIMCFLSIFWRAANSGHPSYENVKIIESHNEYLRKAILENQEIPPEIFSVKVSRIIDQSEERRFTSENLKGLILKPSSRRYVTTEVKNFSVCFLFEGFFIEIYMIGLSLKDGEQPGVLAKYRKTLFVPYVNLFEIEEIVNLLHRFREIHPRP